MTNCGYLNGKWCICAKEACYGQNVTLGGTTIKKYIKNKTSPPSLCSLNGESSNLGT